MTLESEIELMRVRASTSVPSSMRRKRIDLYTGGLAAKLEQTEFCLESLRSLGTSPTNAITESPTDTTSTQKILNEDEEAEFYCDTFWSLLYSMLDILGQIINQHVDLGLDESNVSFNTIKKKLDDSDPTSQLAVMLQSLKQSYAYRHTDAYRNCSNHRRPICLRHTTKTTRHTKGYTTATMPMQITVREICDNPLEPLRPRFAQKREVVEYSEKTLTLIKDRITRILRILN